MARNGMLYDKTGAAFSVDHEYEGCAYVRPLVKVVTHLPDYDGGDLYVEESYEPAAYIVAVERSALFNAPPVVAINEDIAAKAAELDALKAAEKKAIREINAERDAAQRSLQAAERHLAEWMQKHRVMLDLGKLLDGHVLYPLSVRENPYHHSREIPRIPEMRNAKYLAIHSGDFEKGQKWVCKQYGQDSYGTPFQFFYTEEERAATIRAEFEATCAAFRKTPNFDTTSYTSSTTLHYGTLMNWVTTHPSLSIPDDIKAMKADHDAQAVEKRKAALAAELASIATA